MIENVFRIFHTLYNALEDDLSKIIYLKRMNYLLTGDYNYVQNYVSCCHPDIPLRNDRKEEEFLNLFKKGSTVVFYGVGRFSKQIIPYLRHATFNVLFTAKNTYMDSYEGFPVISIDDLMDMKSIYIVICTTKYYNEVREMLINMGISDECIIDIRGFFVCGTGDEYFYEDFLEFREDEVFVDAGCCDLESSIDFYNVCHSIRKVYAFEPDPENYSVCQEKYEKIKGEFPETKLYQCGTWNTSTELRFEGGRAGSSRIGEGEIVIKTVSIDEVVDEDDVVTFIKMDVEGAELESLHGAEKTIKRCKPKLAICLYHNPEDMITLPEFIMNLGIDYKYYIRSYSNAENEVVLYAIPRS